MSTCRYVPDANLPALRHRHGRGAPAAVSVAEPARSPRPLSERELDELQSLLDRIPRPLEPLDVSMLDGYLCALLVQPRRVDDARWLRHMTDVDGRSLPGASQGDLARLHALALRRHHELDVAIERRQWFDPWVFELAPESEATGDGVDVGPSPVEAVYPWVAGFATAMELFPELMSADAGPLTEPLALVYRHLAPEDLTDAEELLAMIETLEPPGDLGEAVEDLVRATLLLADVGRPVQARVQARVQSAPAASRGDVGRTGGRRSRHSNR